MPSNSFITFLKMNKDVSLLIEAHYKFSSGSRGRHNLGYLTRSAVVMLCAAWERYNEDVLLESIDYIKGHVSDVTLLHREVKKTIAKNVREDRNEIKSLEIAGDGWKMLWYTFASNDTDALHTPKSRNLSVLFKKHLGLGNITDVWTSIEDIDQFVTDRGEIAHHGATAQYIRMTKLKKYVDLVYDNVVEVDSFLASELQKQAATRSLAWRQDYSRNLDYYR